MKLLFKIYQNSSAPQKTSFFSPLIRHTNTHSNDTMTKKTRHKIIIIIIIIAQDNKMTIKSSFFSTTTQKRLSNRSNLSHVTSSWPNAVVDFKSFDDDHTPIRMLLFSSFSSFFCLLI